MNKKMFLKAKEKRNQEFSQFVEKWVTNLTMPGSIVL